MVYRVAADIGGTFTDIVIENISDKTFSTIKVLSTPQNQAIAVRTLGGPTTTYMSVVFWGDRVQASLCNVVFNIIIYNI